MSRVVRWYGANVLHLVVLVACFALSGYAASRMLEVNPVGVAAWFVGAVIGHDLVLFPLYALADRPLAAVARRRPLMLPPGNWVNHLRIPVALSLLLLLVWFPLILGLVRDFRGATTFGTDAYLSRWLLVTGLLFAVSAVWLAARLAARPSPAAEPLAPADGRATR